MIPYRAMLDVPRELVTYLSRLLATERSARGTRNNTRALTPWRQALFGLVWYRKREDPALLGAGFGISRATAYRYLDEVTTVLSTTAPDLRRALTRAADEGWSHVILDGKIFPTDRLTQTTTSVKGQPIDTWYSGKARRFGANIQAVMRPDGLPIWTSPVSPGHLHDLTAAEQHHVLGALYWAASQLDLPTLADSGYESAGHGIYTPVKQPVDGNQLGPDNRTYNALLRSLRSQGERGFAILTGRWHALDRITASPTKTGDIVQAALVLTHVEYKYLANPC